MNFPPLVFECQNSEEAEFIYKFTNKNIDGLIPKLISKCVCHSKKKKKG